MTVREFLRAATVVGAICIVSGVGMHFSKKEPVQAPVSAIPDDGETSYIVNRALPENTAGTAEQALPEPVGSGMIGSVAGRASVVPESVSDEQIDVTEAVRDLFGGEVALNLRKDGEAVVSVKINTGGACAWTVSGLYDGEFHPVGISAGRVDAVTAVAEYKKNGTRIGVNLCAETVQQPYSWVPVLGRDDAWTFESRASTGDYVYGVRVISGGIPVLMTVVTTSEMDVGRIAKAVAAYSSIPVEEEGVLELEDGGTDEDAQQEGSSEGDGSGVDANTDAESVSDG